MFISGIFTEVVSGLKGILAKGGRPMRGKALSVGLKALAIFAVTLSVTNTWASVHWKETVLQNFNGTNGSGPQSGLIFDTAGNLYGTTTSGGTYNYGTVFELSPTVG